MDTIWLAEAYPWWRKHGMEARSSTVTSGLIARETERLTVGWGIISPFTRHPVQVAMDARVVQEAAGPGRFLLGFGTSKIFLNNARLNGRRTLGPMREAVEIVRGVLAGAPFEYEGETFSASVPGLQDGAETPRDVPPLYVAATAPKMQALAGEIADGCLTPSITTPEFVRYTRENVGADIDIGCTIVASIHESDRDAGRDGSGVRYLTDGDYSTVPAWSPRGDRLRIAGFGSRWRVVSTDGDRLYGLAPGPPGPTWEPVWSPDGRRIAYLARHAKKWTAEDPLQIWVMNADGTGRHHITRSYGWSIASWAPA